MSVKLRLAKRGRKKLAIYDIVAADSRAPRDGKFIEKVGTFNPNSNPATVVLDTEKAYKWMMNGAQPTDTVRAILSEKGVLYRRHLQIGVNKGAVTQETADSKLNAWLDNKTSEFASVADKLKYKKETAKKDRLAAETKVLEGKIAAKEAKAKAAQAALNATEEVAAEVSEVTEESTPEAAE